MKPLDEMIEIFARERRQHAAYMRDVAALCRRVDPTKETMDIIANGLDKTALTLERGAMDLLRQHDAR